MFRSRVLAAGLACTVLSARADPAGPTTPSQNDPLALDVIECDVGVQDCTILTDEGTSGTCAVYNHKYPIPKNMDGTMAMATIFAILMAFGIGANDAANQWGTSVGSGAIDIRTAVTLGGFMEFLGAWCLGHGVSKTVQKGVAKLQDTECWACGYCDSREAVYMEGMLGALIGASLLLLIASRYAVPLSTTHAIVGGVVGMTIAVSGASCLNWDIDGGLGGIVLSWVVSPIVAGIIGVIAFTFGDYFILRAQNPVERAKFFAPVWYGLATAVMVMLCFFKTKPLKKLFPPNAVFVIGGVTWVAITLVAWAVLTIYKKTTEAADSDEEVPKSPVDGRASAVEMADHSTNESNTKDMKLSDIGYGRDMQPEDQANAAVEVDDAEEGSTGDSDEIYYKGSAKGMFSDGLDKWSASNIDLVYSPQQKEAIGVFRYCLVWLACLESFAHGANDTGNATAAFTAVYLSYSGGQHTCDAPETPAWIMAVGGLGVWIGIFFFGAGVIKTVGCRVTKVDYFRAFCIEFASTMSVVIATALEFPVSTTHCQIGALFFVGLVSQGPKGVSFSLLGLIFLSWVLTLPSSGAIAALVAVIARAIIAS